MPAYMIITAQVHDRERFGAAYAAPAAQLVERFGGRYIVRAPRTTPLEGEQTGAAVVISEWPSRQAAEAFWNSAEYAELKQARQGLATVSVLLTDDL